MSAAISKTAFHVFRKRMRLALALLGFLVLTPALAQVPQVYALYVTTATQDSQGNNIAKCQVVDLILWNGSASYTPPPWGVPPVATAVAPAGGFQIGGTMTGQGPTCP